MSWMKKLKKNWRRMRHEKESGMNKQINENFEFICEWNEAWPGLLSLQSTNFIQSNSSTNQTFLIWLNWVCWWSVDEVEKAAPIQLPSINTNQTIKLKKFNLNVFVCWWLIGIVECFALSLAGQPAFSKSTSPINPQIKLKIWFWLMVVVLLHLLL